MYNIAMTTRPTRAMWWAGTAVFLTVAGVTPTAIVFLVSLGAGGRRVTLERLPSILLIALSTGVGIFVSGRFGAWGSRRGTACHSQT
ncbi:hypothetical protein ACWDWS_25265 [Streptomyces sp. NPDC003328]|uniref:hypothetical protein n=1 Tax=unclassified Streptomyces TaxID=2593676 RepID=UPI003639915D